jgi:ribosomal protein S27AE
MVVHSLAQVYGMIRLEKQCFKCKVQKPLDAFYKHSAMADGHLNKCKECTKNDANQHRSNNLEKIRAYDRERGKHSHRIKSATEHCRLWRQEDQRRTKAHSAVASALRSGSLVRQPCVRCGNSKSVAHHEDYDLPLDVMWLCQPCHKQRHKELSQHK